MQDRKRPKRERVETERPQSLKSYRSFNYVEKNNAKALKVTTNISRRRAIVRNVSLVQVHNHAPVWVSCSEDTHCPWQTPCSHRASKSVRFHMEPKRHRICMGCIKQASQLPVTSDAAVPEQRPMDADRRRRRHRRRCLMSS